MPKASQKKLSIEKKAKSNSLSTRSNVDKYKVFRKRIMQQIKTKYPGKTISQLTSDERTSFNNFMEKHSKQLKVEPLTQRQSKHTFAAAQKAYVRKQRKQQRFVTQALQANEELKEPDQIITRSRSCLPCHGLVKKTPVPIEYLGDQKIPVYRENDMVFDSMVARLLEQQNLPQLAMDEGYETDEQKVLLWSTFSHKSWKKINILIALAPDFRDRVDYKNEYIFHWQAICKWARSMNMTPFKMLMYATMQSQRVRRDDTSIAKELNIRFESNVFRSSFDVRSFDIKSNEIDCTYPSMTLPRTCPLFGMLCGAPNLKAQAVIIEGLYDRFFFYPELLDSHALYFYFIIQHICHDISFHQQVTTMNNSISAAEDECFSRMENQMKPYADEEPLENLHMFCSRKTQAEIEQEHANWQRRNEANNFRQNLMRIAADQNITIQQALALELLRFQIDDRLDLANRHQQRGPFDFGRHRIQLDQEREMYMQDGGYDPDVEQLIDVVIRSPRSVSTLDDTFPGY